MGSFVDRLQGGEVLIADGATGSNYQREGLEAGIPPDVLVLREPERVIKLHRAFLTAGADIILTNTFGATRIRLRDTGYAERTVELNRRAAQLALEAADAHKGAIVAGSMGPVGLLMQPYGALTAPEASQAFAEQAQALTQAGVELLLIETMFDPQEAVAAIEGARRVSDLPLVCTFSFDRGVYTMMGTTAAQVVETLRPYDLTALGANCGHSLENMAQVVDQLAVADPGIPLWIKPNAGLPRPGSDPPEWDMSPEVMAEHIVRYVDAGAQVVGGCCGTSPEHLRAIASAVREQLRKAAGRG